MFDIDVTHLVHDRESMAAYSASIAEIGQDAARITWHNAVETATDAPLVADPSQLNDLRDWLKSFGDWTEDEIANWSLAELNALLLQFIAGDIREMEGFPSYRQYAKAQREGSVSGYLYRCGPRWFFSVSH